MSSSESSESDAGNPLHSAHRHRRLTDPTTLQMAAYAIIVLAGSWWLLGQLKVVLRPLLLAVFISYVLMPYYMKLRMRVPAPIALALLAGLTTAVLMGLALTVFNGLEALEQEGPTLKAKAVAIFRKAEAWMSAYLPPQILGAFAGPKPADEMAADRVTDVALELMNVAALGLVEAATTGLYLLFLLMESARFPNRVRAAYSPEQAAHILHEFGRINAAIISYVKGKVVSSLMLATPIGLILTVSGVRFALLWAVLTFVCNFIPYIGSIVAYSLPVAFAFLQFDSGWVPFVIAVLLLGMHIGSASVVEPMILGRAVRLSPLVILAALSVWGLLWGLPGMFLAVPLTVVMVLVFENIQMTRPLSKLLGG